MSSMKGKIYHRHQCDEDGFAIRMMEAPFCRKDDDGAVTAELFHSICHPREGQPI